MIPFDVVFLVFVSACIHAGWNFMAKTIPGGPVFVWLIALVMSVLLLPTAIWWVYTFGFDPSVQNLGALLITGILHMAYFLVLQKGYESGDLSVVYPLARGSGPLFTSLGAVLFLQENISFVGLTGLGSIVIGVLLISGITQRHTRSEKMRASILYGISTGGLIACYTVWDGYAVKTLAIAPLMVEYVSHPIRVIALAPIGIKNWAKAKSIWQAHRLKILLIAVLSPLAFIMVLYAMLRAPVHFVAPAREFSIVIGVILGARFLKEEAFGLRLAGSMMILIGIVLLAF
jgi:drug/metabolite transporter (DMT)-like permease